MLQSIRRRVKGFIRNNQGAITVEALIVFMPIFGAWMTMVLLFLYIGSINKLESATAAFADILSREIKHLDKAYLDNARTLIGELSGTSPEQLSLRVTALKYKISPTTSSGPPSYYEVVFSQISQGANVPPNLEIKAYENTPFEYDWFAMFDPPLPKVGENNQLMLIEVQRPYIQEVNFEVRNISISAQYLSYPRFSSGWNFK